MNSAAADRLARLTNVAACSFLWANRDAATELSVWTEALCAGTRLGAFCGVGDQASLAVEILAGSVEAFDALPAKRKANVLAHAIAVLTFKSGGHRPMGMDIGVWLAATEINNLAA